MTSLPHRYLFVAGLHRTGTSLLARMIAAHSQISAIENAPVPENEGAYLQGAIPHTAMSGRPGHYATDPAQHFVEGDPLDRLETRNRLEADWAPWFDPAKPWRVEKSPVNLIRMRLLQQLFPLCQFVVILRHPAAMAAALEKWVDTPPTKLIDYALDAYEQTLEDCAYLHSAMVVRYEDLVRRPAAHLAAVHRFCGLASQPSDLALRDGNADYPAATEMSPEQTKRAQRLGYGSALDVGQWEPVIRHPLRETLEAVSDLLSKGRSGEP